MGELPDDIMLTKLTVNLIPRAITSLNTAELVGDTRTDTVNRALQLYAALVEAATGTEPAAFTFDVFGDQTRKASVFVMPPPEGTDG